MTVKKGTLQVGTGGSSITIPNTNIVNNGAINFTRSSDFTYAGIISGTGSFKKSTSSKLTLTSPSTYTGATTIDAGCTIAGGIGSSVGVSIAGTYDLNGAPQTLIDPSGAGTIQSSGTSAVLTITSQKGSTFTGTLATSLSGLTINGTGTFTLSNTTAYTGAVTVSSGTLALTKSSSLSGAINLARNTTLAIKTENITTTGTTATGTIITNPISFGSDATGTNTTVTLNVSQPTTFSGPITCSAPSGTTVTLAVTGGYPVTFTGAQIGAFKIVPSGSNTSVNDNGVYDLKGTAQTFVDPAGDNAIKSSGKNADLTITTQNGSTFSGTIENSISKLTVNGSKILTLSSASTYTGAIIINAQSSLIGNISNTTSITVDGTYDLNGTAQTLNNLSGSGTIKSSNSKAALTLISQNNSTFSGIFDNNLSSVVKSGPGTLTLASATCYTGEIIVSEGTLSLTKASALSGNIKLSQKAILSTNVTEESTFANPISFGSTTVSSPTATINVSKPTTFSGAITCNAAPGTTGTLIISGGYPVTLTGKHTGTFAIILSGKGTSLIVKDDANTNTEVLLGSTWFLLNK